MLNNALQQIGWQGGELTYEKLRVILRQRLQNVDWETASADVRPFLEPGWDVSLLSYNNLMDMLNKY